MTIILTQWKKSADFELDGLDTEQRVFPSEKQM